MGLVRKAKAVSRRISAPVLDARERREKTPLYTSVHTNLDSETHIAEAAQWLFRAQDSGPDRGVAYGTDFGVGFLASYPETTGYIIDTVLALAETYGKDDYVGRAVEMGQWESEIQLETGAVMGGIYNTNPTPAIFNTGMVLLGWASLYEKTGTVTFRHSGERAGKWLLQMQEPNGNWIKGNSNYANAASTVYNVKAAWGLARMGQALESKEFISGAVRNAEFAVSKQLPNGWFADCCLLDAQQPLLHTLAYTMQGLLGIGKIANRPDFIESASRMATSLMALMDEDGFIPGAIRSDFTGAVDWCCLTGTAQTSIVWSELDRLSGKQFYSEAAERANRYLMARHDISSPDPSIRGGLAGSWPVSGKYGQYKILNWATKFFIDALLLRSYPGAAKFVA